MKVKETIVTKKPQKQHTRSPETTIAGREDRLVALAMQQAEKQLEEGTAPAQVVTHFLKLGSTKNELELERLRQENRLISAKIENFKQMGSYEEKLEEALVAFKSYQGERHD